jgi:CheY-like chemotaxis protein
VLVVDDQEVNRRVAELMLAALGYRSLSVDGGAAALAILEASPCAAILMDCRMPDMDGYSATAEIRRREGMLGGRRTPIIALTAEEASRDRQRCLEAGMDDYLCKPVQLAELGRVLARWAPAQPDVVLDPSVLDHIRELEEPGETTLFGDMLRAFQASASEQLQRLQLATRTGDAEVITDAAHALKGSAAALGATRVRALALDLELHGASSERLPGLIRAVDEALQALERISAGTI